MESDPNTGVLQLVDRPTDLAGAGAFGASESSGFSPDGVAGDLTADAEDSTAGSANSLDTTTSQSGTTSTPGNRIRNRWRLAVDGRRQRQQRRAPVRARPRKNPGAR